MSISNSSLGTSGLGVGMTAEDRRYYQELLEMTPKCDCDWWIPQDEAVHGAKCEQVMWLQFVAMRMESRMLRDGRQYRLWPRGS